MSERTIYIFSDGELKRKDNTIYLETLDGKRRFVPVETTREIDVFGEVTLNKRALEYFSQQEILVHFFNHYGYYVGSFYPREHYNSGEVTLQRRTGHDEEKCGFGEPRHRQVGLDRRALHPVRLDLVLLRLGVVGDHGQGVEEKVHYFP